MKFRTLTESFRYSMELHRDKTAIIFLRNGRVETELTYSDLDRDTDHMADLFIENGVCRGDRIVFYLNKSLVQAVAHIALLKIGAVPVPLNPGFKQAEMEYLIRDAEPGLAVVGKGQEEILKGIDPDLDMLVLDTEKSYQDLGLFKNVSKEIPEAVTGPDDPGVIIYTSGTTGNPKGAVLTQENLVHDAVNVINTWAITDSDTVCHALPLFHVHGLCFALHTALIAGARVVMMDSFDPETAVDILSRNKGESVCTVFMAVPAMYSTVLDFIGKKKIDFRHMRIWTSGSAPLPVGDFERISRVMGKDPVEREGMTETGMNFSNPLGGVRKPGSIGLPLPGLQVRIVDPDTCTEVTEGGTGELWLKSRSIIPGYWRKPEETGKVFKDGWFRTGDLGRIDEDGYYYLTDRIKHIIISGGENISPKEVETIINQIDGVIESSVVGIPDRKWGEKVVAAVVIKPGLETEPEKIREHCRKNLHDWKCPKEVRIVEELPRNRMGKVLKEEVKKLF